MESTGITRKVDELGRIVIPIGLRRRLDISEKDSLRIFLNDDAIVLKKDVPSCVFCDSSQDVITYKGKKVCRGCISELKNQREN